METRRADGKRSIEDNTKTMMMVDNMEMVEEEEDHDVQEEENKRRRPLTLSAGRKSDGTTSGGVGSSQPPICQVKNCSADLTDSKKYHRRHKVCEFHARSPAVLLTGIHQRFCQQCSRFHELSEFDEAKRSCRRRLAGHNERRRRSSYDSRSGEGSN